MPTLSPREKMILEELLGMKSGYVLDFSNSSFLRFVKDAIEIDIYSDKGYEEYTSKANKLRQIWDQESEQKIGTLTEALLDYYEDLQLKANKLTDYEKKKLAQMREVCLRLAPHVPSVPAEPRQISSSQHIPIFVGSTFEDLQPHREKVRDALNRLRTHVAGMEYFGASPEMPLDKCLSEVSKCQIYVGIFAMRYGSIPDGYEKSFTHLEYERAQELRLPSLIFIQNQDVPILPKYIDQGVKADKLQKLKDLLQKKHICDFFSTPDELSSKVATAVANELRKLDRKIVITGNIQEAIQGTTSRSAAEIVKLFHIMPVRWQGIKVRGKFKIPATPSSNGFFSTGLSGDFCEALNIEYGHGIQMTWIEFESAKKIQVVAAGNLADQLAILSAPTSLEAVISPVIVQYCNNFGEEQEAMLYRLEHIISSSACDGYGPEDIPVSLEPPF